MQLGTSLISRQARKQSVTSLSTAEAEYRAFATIITQVMRLKSLLADLGFAITYVVSNLSVITRQPLILLLI